MPYPKIKGVGKDFNKMKPAKSRIDTTFYQNSTAYITIKYTKTTDIVEEVKNE